MSKGTSFHTPTTRNPASCRVFKLAAVAVILAAGLLPVFAPTASASRGGAPVDRGYNLIPRSQGLYPGQYGYVIEAEPGCTDAMVAAIADVVKSHAIPELNPHIGNKLVDVQAIWVARETAPNPRHGVIVIRPHAFVMQDAADDPGHTSRSANEHAQSTGGCIDLYPAAFTNRESLAMTIVHESCHVFGLDHYDEVFQGRHQTMASQTFPGGSVLGAGDINGLQHLMTFSAVTAQASPHAASPQVAISLDHAMGPVAGGDFVIISGEGIGGHTARIYFGDIAVARFQVLEDNQIAVAATPSQPAPGPVPVRLVNAQGQPYGTTAQYTYEGSARPSAPAAVDPWRVVGTRTYVQPMADADAQAFQMVNNHFDEATGGGMNVSLQWAQRRIAGTRELLAIVTATPGMTLPPEAEVWFGIYDGTTNELVGAFQLYSFAESRWSAQFRDHLRTVERSGGHWLGICRAVNPSHRGQGLMAEVLPAMFQLARHRLNCDVLVSDAYLNNAASIRSLLRHGFTHLFNDADFTYHQFDLRQAQVPELRPAPAFTSTGPGSNPAQARPLADRGPQPVDALSQRALVVQGQVAHMFVRNRTGRGVEHCWSGDAWATVQREVIDEAGSSGRNPAALAYDSETLIVASLGLSSGAQATVRVARHTRTGWQTQEIAADALETSRPSVASYGSQVHVFYQNTAHQLVHRWTDTVESTQWREEIKDPIELSNGHAIASTTYNGQFHLLYPGLSRRGRLELRHQWYDPSAGRWANEILATDVARDSDLVVASFSNEFHVAYRTTERSLMHRWFDPLVGRWQEAVVAQGIATNSGLAMLEIGHSLRLEYPDANGRAASVAIAERRQ